jgi:ABC-type sugar transport system ATPase subunit
MEMKDIHKRFPGVYALKGVSMDITPGEVHALVGENGAGKSTLIKIISGAYQPDSGTYLINGNPANISKTLDAIEKGIAVIYQELNLVESLSIAENVFFGALPVNKTGRVLWNSLYEETKKITDEIGLDISPKMKVGYLSIAQEQLVEIAKALSKKPRVIVMDEPTSALSTQEIDNLFSVIRKLKANGAAIVYVSHKLDEIFAISDKVSVLRDGQYIGTEAIGNLSEEKLISMMVGRKLSDMYPKTEPQIGEVALEVKELTTEKVKDISFYARKGEIVGFAGLMGAGRTELAKAVFGADEKLKGEVLVAGKKVPKNSTRAAVKYGIGMIPESRKDDGILPNLCVKKNMTIASIKQFVRTLMVRGSMEKSGVDEMICNLCIRTPGMDQMIANLSGGNQQKVIVSRWLMKQNLKVLIVDEPTRGIDVGAKAEIYNILDKLAHQGLAIVMMSSEMPEILSMCDRIYVMKSGRIIGEYQQGEATQEKLLSSAIYG